MAVLNRKMFSRGGFAHRGTGITTGLTPVQKFAPGGEVTGTIDESIRHAMSKFSNFHFVANTDAKLRLIKMGEKKK